MQIDDAMAMLRRQPDWLATLRAYWESELQSRQQVSDSDRWLARLTDIPEVAPERLSGIHGRLIAFGYLKFELSAKDATLRYQLTPLGRTAVSGETAAESGEAAAEGEWAISA